MGLTEKKNTSIEKRKKCASQTEAILDVLAVEAFYSPKKHCLVQKTILKKKKKRRKKKRKKRQVIDIPRH